MCPERAPRADLSIGVINSLFMRAANDPIRDDDRFDGMFLHEPEDAVADDRVHPNVSVLGEPALHGSRVLTLRVHNPNRDFARARVVGTVERDGRGRIATEAPASFLFQRRIGTAFEFHGKSSLSLVGLSPYQFLPARNFLAEAIPWRAYR